MINYNGLFEILDRREMKKTDLLKVISSGTLAKLNKNQNIQTEILNKICEYLKVQPGDIMQYYEIEKIELIKKNEEILYEAGYRQRIKIIYPTEEDNLMYEYNEIQDEIRYGNKKLLSKKIYENIEDIKSGKIKIPKTFKEEEEVYKKDPYIRKLFSKN